MNHSKIRFFYSFIVYSDNMAFYKNSCLVMTSVTRTSIDMLTCTISQYCGSTPIFVYDSTFQVQSHRLLILGYKQIGVLDIQHRILSPVMYECGQIEHIADQCELYVVAQSDRPEGAKPNQMVHDIQQLLRISTTNIHLIPLTAAIDS